MIGWSHDRYEKLVGMPVNVLAGAIMSGQGVGQFKGEGFGKADYGHDMVIDGDMLGPSGLALFVVIHGHSLYNK